MGAGEPEDQLPWVDAASPVYQPQEMDVPEPRGASKTPPLSSQGSADPPPPSTCSPTLPGTLESEVIGENVASWLEDPPSSHGEDSLDFSETVSESQANTFADQQKPPYLSAKLLSLFSNQSSGRTTVTVSLKPEGPKPKPKRQPPASKQKPKGQPPAPKRKTPPASKTKERQNTTKPPVSKPADIEEAYMGMLRGVRIPLSLLLGRQEKGSSDPFTVSVRGC